MITIIGKSAMIVLASWVLVPGDPVVPGDPAVVYPQPAGAGVHEAWSGPASAAAPQRSSIQSDSGRAASPANSAGPWSMFRHDPSRTGRTTLGGPLQPLPLWEYPLGGLTYSSPAIGPGGTVYGGSADGVYAVNADGTTRWTFPLSAQAISSPALADDGTLYVGSTDHNLYAIRSQNGTEKWAFSASDEIWSSPVVGPNGTVYVGSADDNLYAIDPRTGAGVVLCRAEGDIVSSPAIGRDGTVYVGSLDGRLYACRMNGPSNAWDLGRDVVASPAIAADGSVAVGSLDGNLYVVDPNAEAAALCFSTGGRIVSSPAIAADGTMYVGSFDGNVYAVGADCRLRWSFSTGGPVASSPSVDADGIIYVGSFDGSIYAVGPDGSELWSFPTRHDVVWSSPAIGPDRVLYAAATDTTGTVAHLYAIASGDVRITFDDPTAGADIHVQIREPEDTPASGTLFYRRGGERRYASTPFSGEVEIPASYATERGLEYWIRLADGSTFPPLNPAVRPAIERVQVPDLPVDLDLQPQTYRMVSVPLALENPSILSVLGDDYGAYDRARWRVFRWDQNAGNGAGDYVEHPNTGAQFTPGTSFFLVTNDGAGFNVENGRSVDSSRPQSVTLPPNAWTQVGNPFAFPVAWDDIQFAPQQINRNEIYFFDGTEFIPARDAHPEMRPWEGYFVRNNSGVPVQMIVPPREAPSGEDAEPEADRHRRSGPMVQLLARVPGTRMRDTQNWIGFRRGAAEGRDEHDFLEPPSPGPDLQLSILQGNERYAGSFKPMTDDGERWEIEVQMANPADTRRRHHVEIKVQEDQPLPAGFQVHVFDLQAGRFLKLADGTFSLDLDEAAPDRRLAVLIGTEAFASDPGHQLPAGPTELSLAQNYPNPFNWATSIRYQVQERRHVVLEVSDLLGRRVARLVDEMQSPGAHEITWEGVDDSGRTVASGVYIYRLTSGTSTVTRSMLLLR